MYHKILLSCSLLVFNLPSFADALDAQRLVKIAQYSIKMQVIDDPTYTENKIKLTELMLGNVQDQQERQKLLENLPKNRIIKDLKEKNLRGLSAKDIQIMSPILDTEIAQLNKMIKSCRVTEPNQIRALKNSFYEVSIQCLIPTPDTQSIQEFRANVQRLNQDYQVQNNYIRYRAGLFSLKQKAIAQAELKDQFKILDTAILIEQRGAHSLITRMNDNQYFPNIVLQAREEAFQFRAKPDEKMPTTK